MPIFYVNCILYTAAIIDRYEKYGFEMYMVQIQQSANIVLIIN